MARSPEHADKVTVEQNRVRPFPRSEESVRALATLRGAASGFQFAESFELLRERS